MQNEVYPVYILSRVVLEIQEQCKKAVPNETLGRLLGYHCQYQGKQYVKIVDWVGGDLHINSGNAFAHFTMQGSRECEIYLDEKYRTQKRPIEVCLFHSHPFGSNPCFSSTDYNTFLSFPYNRPGNVFILLDPLSQYFKTFIISSEYPSSLQQIPWILYQPKC